MPQEYTVVLTENDEGGFTAECVEIPGAISEGDTVEEAMDNVADAIRMVLEARREQVMHPDAVSPNRSIRTVTVDA